MFLGMQAPAHIQSNLPESNHPCINFALVFTNFAQFQPNLPKSNQFRPPKIC